MTRRWLSLILTITLLLGLDQLTKAWILANLALGETVEPIPTFAPYFAITRSENNGAAFGLLPQAGSVFLIIAVIVVIGLVIFFPRIPDGARLTRFGIGFVVGGALGNVLDRVQHGAVIDFIHYTLPGLFSNVSNIADHAIVIGVFLIFIEAWRADPKRQKLVTNTPSESAEPQ